MNKKAEGINTEDEDNTIVLDNEDEGGAPNDEGEGNNADNEGEGTTNDEGNEGAGEGDDTVVVSIGEESPPPEDEHANAPEWVRELRKANREDKRRIRELEEKLNAATKTETKPVQLGKKPTLEEHDYDAEKFEAALENWYQQKRVVDEQNAKAEAEAKAAQDTWQAKLNSYGEAKTKLKVKDFEDAEDVAKELLSVTQQGIILQGAENPALVIYALGKNPAKVKELAAITDPVKYAFAVAKLETQLKVTQRKAPPPERTVSGTGRVAGTVDSTLERLREEAAKTGDYTKVVQYRNQQKRKQT
jgi:hypothetical protein